LSLPSISHMLRWKPGLFENLSEFHSLISRSFPIMRPS